MRVHALDADAGFPRHEIARIVDRAGFDGEFAIGAAFQVPAHVAGADTRPAIAAGLGAQQAHIASGTQPAHQVVAEQAGTVQQQRMSLRGVVGDQQQPGRQRLVRIRRVQRRHGQQQYQHRQPLPREFRRTGPQRVCSPGCALFGKHRFPLSMRAGHGTPREPYRNCAATVISWPYAAELRHAVSLRPSRRPGCGPCPWPCTGTGRPP